MPLMPDGVPVSPDRCARNDVHPSVATRFGWSRD